MMKLWLIKWAVLVITSTGPHMFVSEGGEHFETKAECQEMLAKDEPRMSDWVRGNLNLNFRVEVQVKGDCQTDGKPA